MKICVAGSSQNNRHVITPIISMLESIDLFPIPRFCSIINTRDRITRVNRDRKSNQRKGETMTRQIITRIAFVFIALLALASWSIAAEHPAEHPEERLGDVSRPGITKGELADAIRGYVEKDSALKGGYFMVYDSKAGESLTLSLLKVHENRLSSIGNDVYFVCADFKTPEGKVYDLDIFMKGHDKDHLAVTEVSVHKEAGVERYTWHEEGGVWEKSHMEGSATESEHPSEHPE